MSNETKGRIEDGLGEGGVFIWRSVWSPATCMKRNWYRLVGDDDYAGEKSIADYEKEDIEASEERETEDARYSVKSEWPLSLPEPALGWNDGPW